VSASIARWLCEVRRWLLVLSDRLGMTRARDIQLRACESVGPDTGVPTIGVVADVVEGIYSQGQCPHAETLEAAAGSEGLRLL